jgi:hypothetical protein
VIRQANTFGRYVHVNDPNPTPRRLSMRDCSTFPGRAYGNVCDFTNHHGIVRFSQRVNVPVGPSGPSSATRTASRAPSSTVSVPAYPLRFVLVKPGETALTLIPSGSSSIAMASVKALSAVLDEG